MKVGFDKAFSYQSSLTIISIITSN